MSRPDRLAVLLSLAAILAAYLVAVYIFEDLPHLEDEMAYVWQAQAAARGYLTLPSPPSPSSFLVPFVIDYQGQRFGKYPLGWPALLAVGEFFQVRALLNPLLSGLAVWLTYVLGKRLFGELTGLLAAGLTLTSPFFLMNAGSLLSHPFGLVLGLGFTIAWLDAFIWRREAGPWLPVLVAGGSLGVLALSRPLTAVGIGFPFALHGLWLLVRGDGKIRKRVLVLGMIALSLGLLHFVWQFALTGDPFLNPYTLWWEYDKIGFGPGVGRAEGGHNLSIALLNTDFNLKIGARDLFGWLSLSYLFLPFGLAAIFYNRQMGRGLHFPALLTAALFVSLVIAYMAYWIGAFLFGPRYYYEGLFSLTIFTAAGIAFLAGWPNRPGEPYRPYSGLRKLRPLLVTALVTLLVLGNLVYYLPLRLSGMHGLYGISRERLAPFLTQHAQDLAPALVFVHIQEKWTDYGTLMDLNSPFLDTPYLVVVSRSPVKDHELAKLFPERAVYHYYPREPFTFYLRPQPDQ